MIDTSIARTVWKSPKTLKDCHTILDLRELARRSLPNPIFHHLEGGAETEVTARRNIRAFDDAKLIPRCLVDVGAVRQAAFEEDGAHWITLLDPEGNEFDVVAESA